MTETFNLNVPKFMFLDMNNIWKKGRPPCAQVNRNSWENIRQMTKKMAQNREKMRAKLNIFDLILVLYSQPHEVAGNG